MAQHIDFSLFKDTPFHSEMERQYCVKQLVARERVLTNILYACQVAMLFLSPTLIYFLPHTNFQMLQITSLHIILLPFIALIPFLKDHESKKKMVLAVSVVCLTGWTSITYFVSEENTGSLFIPFIFILQVGMLCCLLPFRARVHGILEVYFIANMAFAFSSYSTPYLLTAVGVIVTLLFSNIGNIAYKFARRDIMNSFRDKLGYLPNQILKKSIQLNKTVDDLCIPKKRFCVVLSSDWRNYQSLSQRISPEQLAATLADYYTLCSFLLDQHIPKQNYFCDWIADELFVVIYSDDEEANAEIVEQAITFSKALIAAKDKFLEHHPAPEAIDVGLSAGTAYVGALGPESQTKATALGNVPGRARRIQTAGKLLRTFFGQKDRIIFDHSIGLMIEDHVKIFALEDEHTLKDLSESSLMFIESPNLSADGLDDDDTLFDAVAS